MDIGYVAVVGRGKDFENGECMQESRVLKKTIFRHIWHAYRAHVIDYVMKTYEIDQHIDDNIEMEELHYAIIRANEADEDIDFLEVLCESKKQKDISASWECLFEYCADVVEYTCRDVMTVKISDDASYMSRFTILIRTRSGDGDLDNKLMFNHMFPEKNEALLHAVLHCVFLTLGITMGDKAPEELKELLDKHKTMNMKQVIAKNMRLFKTNIPQNIKNAMKRYMFTSASINVTIDALKDIIYDHFEDTDIFTTEYLLTVATNLRLDNKFL